MTAKPRTGTVILDGEEPSGDGSQGIFDAANDIEGGALIDISEEIRSTSGVVVQVVRQEPREYQGHVADMTVGEFSAQKVADLYGPGVYRVRFIGPNKRFLPGGGQLKIAPKRVPGAEQPASGGNDVHSILQLFARRDSEDRERRAREEEAGRVRRDDWIKIGLSSLGGIATLVSAFKTGGGTNSDLMTAVLAALKPAPQMTPADMVGMLSQLKELSGGSDKADPIDQLSKLLTVARDLGGGGDSGGSSNWIDLVRDGLKAAPDILSGMQRAGPQVVQVQSVPGAPLQPQAQIPQSEPAQPAPQEGQDMWVLIQPVLHNIAVSIEGWARDGKDAALRAEVLLDDLPKWLADRLKPEEALVFLNHPQWWEHLTAFHPPLAQYKEWIDDMRAELIELVKEQIKEAATPPAAENTGE